MHGHPLHRTRIHSEGALSLEAGVLTIGAFDGVHCGHQVLIGHAVAAARAEGVPSVVWTFDPPPKVFFGRAEQLSPLAEKLERIACLGADHIVVSRFDEVYCSRSAEAFLDDLARVNPLGVWVGGDFRFGKGQAGDFTMLARAFPTHVLPPVRCPAGEVVSSTRIRALRREGMTEAAGALLGWLGSGESRLGRAA